MTIPATIATGGHVTDPEIVDAQLAVLALLGAFSGDVLKAANGGTGASVNTSSTDYVALQASAPGTQQAGSFNVSGTGVTGHLQAGAQAPGTNGLVIGTLSDATVYVNGSTGAATMPRFLLGNTDTTNGNGADFAFSTYDTNSAHVGAVRLVAILQSHTAGAVSADLALITRNAGTFGECMRLLANGHVTVGTGGDRGSPFAAQGLAVYANNAAAVAGGLSTGAFYRTGADPDPVCVVH